MPRFIAIVVALGASALPLKAQWTPTGPLAGVPVSEDCARSAGAAAYAAEGPQIFTCATAVEAIEAAVPRAAHFFLVREYARIAIDGANESQADCWAAREIGAAPDGMSYVDAGARWLEAESGDFAERALRIRECSGLPFESPATGDRCCTAVGSCALPGEGTVLFLGAGCYCGSDNEEGGFESGHVCVVEPGEGSS